MTHYRVEKYSFVFGFFCLKISHQEYFHISQEIMFGEQEDKDTIVFFLRDENYLIKEK